MKEFIIPEGLVTDVINIIADGTQKTYSNGIVFNVIKGLSSLQPKIEDCPNKPVELKPEEPKPEAPVEKTDPQSASNL